MRIAIDGPAGAGKSTVAAQLAARLGLPRIDTGAMYRALAYVALREGIPVDDGQRLAERLRRMTIAVDGSAAIVDGVTLRDELRTRAIDAVVSRVSRHPEVRAEMVARQRALAAGGAVVDGRDIGTRVLPDADLKVYLTASPAARARRRARQLQARGESVDLAAIEAEIRERDARDAPQMVRAPDAVVIDTTDMDVAAVVEAVLHLVEAKKR